MGALAAAPVMGAKSLAMANAVIPTTFKSLTMANTLLPAAAAASPLAQGVIGGSMLASPQGLGLLQTLGMSPLGGMASMVPGGATAGLGGLAATPLAAGSTAALEASKAALIKNAMTQNAMQNAIMQNVAGGQAAQNLAGTAGSQLFGKSLSMANAPLAGGASPFSAINQAAGLGTDMVAKTASAVPKITKASYLTEGLKPPVSSIEAQQFADLSRGVQTGGLRMPTGAETTGLKMTPDVTSHAIIPRGSPIVPGGDFLSNLGNLIQNPSLRGAGEYVKEHPYATAGMGYGLYSLMKPKYKPPEQEPGYIRPYDLEVENLSGQPMGESTAEREQLRYKYTPLPVYRADDKTKRTLADGGLASLAVGGTVEQMSRRNTVGNNANYPQANIQSAQYSNPTIQMPIPQNVIKTAYDAPTDPYTGEVRMADGGMFGGRGIRAIVDAVRNAPSNYQYTYDPETQQYTQIASEAGKPAGLGGLGQLVRRLRSAVSPDAPPRYDYNPDTQQYTQLAGGGLSDLGDYSDGGRLLKGPGDGVSDSIPASIGGRQPARLADNEFVIPARIVSEIGNGSTDAGARKLYQMMDRIQRRRSKTIGKGRIAVDSKAHKEVDRL